MNCFRGLRNETDDNRQYSTPVRKFSLTMFYYSPKAFKFLRNKFSNRLPHPSTLRKWYSNSDVNGEPGILLEAMKSLKSVSQKMKSEGKVILVSLTFDETAIKRHIQWLHEQKRFSGFVTDGHVHGKSPIASNVLVFMATVLNASPSVSIPVAYFCIASLTHIQKSVLLQKVLQALADAEAVVLNITFDGLKVNLTMCESLGACFDPANIISFIISPIDGHKIYILLDACHMLKLIRSVLGDFEIINDPKNGKIESKYIKRLVEYREKNNFITHRLNKHHILFWKNRMNVKLAAQTLSQSVASSMEYLRKSGDKRFENCRPTSNFVSSMDTLFNVFNAKGIRENQPMKSAIDANNASQVFDFFEKTSKHLMQLRLRGILCVNSRRSTGFIGSIVNMKSAKLIYEQYVNEGLLSHLALFYHSQDLLESFFSRVRALLGCNDNPNLQEFKGAIRKLLFFNEVSSSVFANCEDNLNILNVSSVTESQNNGPLPMSSIDNVNANDEDDFEDINDINRSLNLIHNGYEIHRNEDVTIAFVAGMIEKKVETSRFGCNDCEIICKSVFKCNEKIISDFIQNNKSQKPCLSTFIICKHTHDVLIEHMNPPYFDYKSIQKLISEKICSEILYSQTDFSHDIEHKHYLVGFIVDEYVRAHATYVAQCITLEQQKMLIRNINRKVIHFKGQ